MTKAFTFGKFLPFHKGHEAMIRFALTKCDFLTVLVCASDTEKLSASVRKNWIEKTFPTEINLEVRMFEYLEKDLPNSSDSSREISKIWSTIFKTQFPDYTIVVTSEEYGNYVAEFMKINHLPFDLHKANIPVSATIIRSDVFSSWHYLPDSVKSDLAIKIVILGTESTGKTTLLDRLITHYSCTGVHEVGREIIENSNSLTFEDLYIVASEHAKRIEQASIGSSPLVIIDTDIHTTMSYAQFIFEKKLEVNQQTYRSNKADLYLFLNNDAQYIQDGTRLSEHDRNALDASHRKILKEFDIQCTEIDGEWEMRFQKSVSAIDELLKNRKLDWTK